VGSLLRCLPFWGAFEVSPLASLPRMLLIDWAPPMTP